MAYSTANRPATVQNARLAARTIAGDRSGSLLNTIARTPIAIAS
jgi:hypothetical protein